MVKQAVFVIGLHDLGQTKVEIVCFHKNRIKKKIYVLLVWY